ncbi:MAG: RdgB/HAM1 family non-canonical purine NTP pyrophosphatase [Candidatus Eisenbacteria bacterium]|nr:RdgB/HAM1 family non-canonical purine NTP pyrophosphatase [Candidatus Eisenbacteria bacterium]
MTTYVVATFNRDKARELAALLAAPGRRLRFLDEFAGATAPEETGATLIENARIKALAAVAATGLPAIADDTGLEVDALDGAPGAHAARFAGPRATYADNVALLLERLRGVPPARRTARFRSVCVARFPDGSERVGGGVIEGRITDAPRGAHGFGYDPVFEIIELGRTLAELDASSKNARSHRALAIRALAARLEA